METVNCILCGNGNSKFLFSKDSGKGARFTLMKCMGCGLEFISPRPSRDEIKEYYASDYFSRRTERGYNDYFSDNVRREIERVFSLNLMDLGFFEFETALGHEKSSLDIGCAAGYFVDFMKKRGWNSMGVDISDDCVDFARESGLNVINGNYLEADFGIKFDLITLWASIEHLHQPHLFLEKIHEDLKANGMLYISTCRTGGVNFKRLFGKNWRFYNFPEHLYFFSKSTLRKMLNIKGFGMAGYKTYGSGVGRTGSSIKKTADFFARNLYSGDMMIIAARKKEALKWM